jgi:hypothetical protein
MTVRAWFRRLRAQDFAAEWQPRMIRFSTGHVRYPSVEIDITRLTDLQALIDHPPILQLPYGANLLVWNGVTFSYEVRQRRDAVLGKIRRLMDGEAR